VPSARSAGGFRLYTRADIERFVFIKKFKPLGFPLDEVQELITLLDAVRDGTADHADHARLEQFATHAEAKCVSLRDQLADAELIAANIRARLHAREPALPAPPAAHSR
jgi:DNA-binding transcriptional MerR regulator